MPIIIHRNPRPLLYKDSYLMRPDLKDRRYAKAILSEHPLDYVKLAKNDKHICAIGFMGLTYFGALIHEAYGLNQQAIGPMLQRIFNAKETGTLYPQHKLTILPYNLDPDIYLNGIRPNNVTTSSENKPYSLSEIGSFLDDAITAETEYIKSSEVYFCFKDIGFDAKIYNYYLLKIAEKPKTRGLTMHIESVNNEEFIDDETYNSLKTRNSSRVEHHKRIERRSAFSKAASSNRATSWYHRAKHVKHALALWRKIPMEERARIRKALAVEHAKKSAPQLAEIISKDRQYPPQYYPEEWAAKITAALPNMNLHERQALRNRISQVPKNKQWRTLHKALAEDESLV